MKERMILKFREKFTMELRIEQKECVNFETLEKELMNTISIVGHIQAKGFGASHGQCQAIIKNYVLNGKHTLTKEQQINILKICDLWDKYHLNDLKAGTKKQIDLLKHNNLNNVKYDIQVEFLKENNLYIDNGVKYGSVWYCEKVPSEIIKELKDLFQNTPTKK